MGYTLKQNLATFLYNKLPNTYRKNDGNEQLKKYIEALVEEGFLYSLNEILGLQDLLDVENCPSEFFRYLCSNFGVEYSEEIPESYQRRFLNVYPELLARKGTTSVVEFIVREVLGQEVNLLEENRNKLFRTWASESELEKWGLTLSKTFSAGNSDIKYLLGSEYNENNIKLEIYVADPNDFFNLLVDDDLNTIVNVYLEKFLPAHIGYSFSYIVEGYGELAGVSWVLKDEVLQDNTLYTWDDSKIWNDSITWKEKVPL